MLRPFRKPLILMTPKSLLRHKRAVSNLEDLVPGTSFHRVMVDGAEAGCDVGGVTLAADEEIKRVILCSGKVYFDLLAERRKRRIDDIAVLRVEQLYPFPQEELEEIVGGYPNLERLIWVQEEPLNMGAWNYVRPYLRQLVESRFTLHYVGRPESSSPAEGSTTLYRINQQSLIEQAFDFDKQAQTSSVVKEQG
jgi:2-oxoglutarate dehydrogenase E1 component